MLIMISLPFVFVYFFSRRHTQKNALQTPLSDDSNAIMLQSKKAPKCIVCILFEFQLKIHHHHCQQQRDPLYILNFSLSVNPVGNFCKLVLSISQFIFIIAGRFLIIEKRELLRV